MNELTSRESLLDINAGIIAQLQDRLKVKRYRPNEADASKLGYLNALNEAVKIRNELIRDTELEEIKTEIDRLKGK